VPSVPQGALPSSHVGTPFVKSPTRLRRPKIN